MFLTQAHVQERVRTALLVALRSFVGAKTHVLIEALRLRVLLVDRQFLYAKMADPIAEKALAQTLALSSGAMNSISSVPFSVPMKATGRLLSFPRPSGFQRLSTPAARIP